MARSYRFYRTDDFSDKGFARLLEAFDLLHDYASDGHLIEATELRPGEIVGWLEDILFTLEETIREIDAHDTRLIHFVDSTANNTFEAKEEAEL